jgi:penicillin amidase
VPGDESHGWTGWVAFDDLPRCEDPPEGFLFSANNPTSVVAGAPYVGIDTATPWRARRILSAVRTMDGATVADMAALHHDVISIPARWWSRRLVGWEALTDWDGAMAAESTAAAAYSLFRLELLSVVLERSGLGQVLDHPRNRILPGVVPESVLWRVIDQHARAGDTSLLGGWTWPEAIDEARRSAEKTWDGEAWGDLHHTVHRHPLSRYFDPAPVPAAGDMDTVMAAAYIPTHGLAMRAGSVARYAFDLADWDRSGWVIPLGAVGEPGERHAYDQQDAWRAGRLLPAHYTRAAIDAAATTGSS